MRKLIRITGIFFLVLILVTSALFMYIVIVATVSPPVPDDMAVMNKQRTQLDTNCYVIGNNWLRKSKSGLWEMYVEGKPFDRGVINGKLATELVHYQEEAFSEQINKMVPSAFYRNFLKYLIGWFNRNLEDNIPLEYKLEIYGVSQSASHEFDYIGSAYQRMMNYHAAHDIGHALKNLALVGCSSFATWDVKSADGHLLIGRNFDFYVGDHFAENKIVQFVAPEKGYKFMMVTWGGMTGVVSGMNIEGLTITLNAAKSEIPTGSATPISLLAREILQYAKNIDEAIAIAHSRKTFVSESFLIGSANDKKAVSIEISPDTLAVYDPESNFIICTNHYKSGYMGSLQINQQQVNESASVYRDRHIAELLDTLTINTPEKTARILRDKSGLHNTFIGYGNEKSVNQLLAHHSIIFDPNDKKVWVSTQPWQLGAYICYDLNKIFSMHGLASNHELNDSSATIPADTFLLSQDYRDFVAFREMVARMQAGGKIDPARLVSLNPEFYHSYVLAGDYCFKNNNPVDAEKYYSTALTKEIATKNEEKYIQEQLQKCLKKS